MSFYTQDDAKIFHYGFLASRTSGVLHNHLQNKSVGQEDLSTVEMARGLFV